MTAIQSVLESLRGFTLLSVTLRLFLALVCGAAIGYGRTKKERAAGLRTYTLISVGAALAVIISIYEYECLHTIWADTVAAIGEKFDASRIAAQTISGIGFLGAGIIFKIAHQQVSGLTTATGLFATVCMGIAAGAGFFECVIPVMLIIILVLNIMSPTERDFKRRLRNITIYVEFRSVDDIGEITRVIEEQKAQIYDIDIERTEATEEQNPAAIFILQLSRDNHSHSGMLSSVAELGCVYSVQELIS